MVRRALRELLDRVRWRPVRGSGLDGGASDRAGMAGGSALQPGARDAPPPGSSRGKGDAVQTNDDIEEVDRLVDLTFVALLRRKPDRDTLLAYREGFADGTTFNDLIADVIGSDEYRSIKRRRKASAHSRAASPAPQRGDDLSTTVTLLTTRLVERGWRPQLGAMAEADRGGGDGAERRMRSLRVTLSVLDRL